MKHADKVDMDEISEDSKPNKIGSFILELRNLDCLKKPILTLSL